MVDLMTDERLSAIANDIWMENTHEYELLQSLKAERKKVEELEAKLARVEVLPEGWRSISYKTTNEYTNLHGCADELETLLDKESSCKHENTGAASAIRKAPVWCPDCKKWVVLLGKVSEDE